MSISKTFGAVTIAAINAPKTTTPGATAGMVVVYQQGHNTVYDGTQGLSAAKAAMGIAPGHTVKEYSGERKFSEFYSTLELSSANDGEGVKVGDTVPGVAISTLNSTMPFFAGQQPYARTGLYYSPVIEEAADNQPNDRAVDNSALAHNVAAALAQTTLQKQQVAVGEPAIN